jgi:uncharacterized protein (TIGR03790 family)
MVRALIVLLMLASATRAYAELVPATTVVVANRQVPAGVELAKTFMRYRGIPAQNLIILDLPTEEAITWSQYSETLLNPLRTQLLAAGLLTGQSSGQLAAGKDVRGRQEYLPTAAPKLSWIVLMHGVPLKIQPSGSKVLGGSKQGLRGDQACVDSELALLATVNLDPEGAKPNPWFQQRTLAPVDAAEVIRTARLDGPTPADVLRALQGAWRAEEHGLRGRAYVDIGGPYPDGDTWFKQAAEMTRQLGFPTDIESTRQQFGAKARADAPAFYLGWYSQKAEGRFASPTVKLAPGAIALHLHSFSANTLRNDGAGWTPWLVKQGAAHTSGNVYEPYLTLTLRPDLLIQGLQQGMTVGEAAWYATPAVSWQGTILGDPFYRPFARALPEQLADFQKQPDELGAYAVIRAAQLRPKEESAQALADLEAALGRNPSLPLALAWAQAREGQNLPFVWNPQVWAGLDKADDGLLWEIALFFDKKGLKEPAKKALQGLQARPDWKEDPEFKAHWDAVAR